MRLLPALLALLAVLSSHHAAGSVDAVPQKLRMPRRALATATPTTSPSPRNYQPFSEQFRYNPQGTARSSHAGPVALDLTIVTLPLSNAAVASAAVTVNGDAFVGTRDGAMMAWGDINGVDKFELRWQFQAGGMSARLLRCCRRIFAYACTLHPTPSSTDAASVWWLQSSWAACNVCVWSPLLGSYSIHPRATPQRPLRCHTTHYNGDWH